MRFYTNQHKYHCGIDLHTRKNVGKSELMNTGELS